MRIRETKVIVKEICFYDACVFEIFDINTDSYLYADAKDHAETLGYIHNTVYHNDSKIYAKFCVTEERDMTPAEEMAWHYLKANKICETYGYDCPEVCPFHGINSCPFADDIGVVECKQILEGKEVINDE